MCNIMSHYMNTCILLVRARLAGRHRGRGHRWTQWASRCQSHTGMHTTGFGQVVMLIEQIVILTDQIIIPTDQIVMLIDQIIIPTDQIVMLIDQVVMLIEQIVMLID